VHFYGSVYGVAFQFYDVGAFVAGWWGVERVQRGCREGVERV